MKTVATMVQQLLPTPTQASIVKDLEGQQKLAQAVKDLAFHVREIHYNHGSIACPKSGCSCLKNAFDYLTELGM